MAKRMKFILPLIFVFMLCLGALLLTACGRPDLSEDEIINMGYPIAVNYNFMGGKAGESEGKKVRVAENSYIPEPGSSSSFGAPALTGYSIRYYGVAQTDDDGNILYDINNQPVITKVWDFKTDRVTEDITLCAIWWKNFNLNLHYTRTYTENGEKKVENLVKEIDVPRNVDGSPTQTALSASKVSGYTFLGYYLNSNLKDDEVTFPNTFAFSDEITEIDVYGDNLTGTFQIVESVADLTKFSFLESTNVYLLTDIDMNDIYDENKSFTFPSSYRGKFYGNGHTISNLKIEKSQTSATDTNFGIFNILDNNAEIDDIIFENVTYTANVTNIRSNEFNVGLLAGTVRGAMLTKVKVTGTLNVTVSEGINVDLIHSDATYSSAFGNLSSQAELDESCAFAITVNKTLPET